MTIYLVRHGQTVFNAESRVQGRMDSPLTELGRAQALALGGQLRQLLGDVEELEIESSPQGRAKATAEIIRSSLGVRTAIRFDGRLREISLGSWEGLTQGEIEARWPGAWRSTVRQSWLETCPDGEPYPAAEGRLRSWLDDALWTAPRVVVSHGVAIGILRGLYLGLSRAEMLEFPVPQGLIWAFGDGRVRPVGV